MKRKLLLVALFTLAFAMLFAITAFAKNVDLGLTDTSGNAIVVPTVDADGDSLTWYRATTQPTDGTYYTYLSGETTYYLVSVKTNVAAYVDDNHYVRYNYSGISTNTWSSGTLVAVNLEGLKDADGNGPTTLGFVFEGTGLKYIKLCASITSLNGLYGNTLRSAFYGAKNLQEIEFESGSQITEIPTFAFYECNQLKDKTIILPENLTTINKQAFQGFKTTFYAPKSLTTIDADAFLYGKADIYFTGDEQTVEGWAYTPNSLEYVNHCEIYYSGEHNIPEGGEPTCNEALGCIRCANTKQAFIVEKALGHNFDLNDGAVVFDIIYTSFSEKGIKCVKCSRCDNLDNTTYTAEPVFTALGYSYKEDGAGIAGGYSVNQKALAEYKSVTKKSVEFGIVMFNPEYATADTFFTNGDLSVKDRAILIKVNDVKYANINFKINNFTDLDLDIVIAIYVNVITTDDETENSAVETYFVQSTQRKNDSKSVIAETIEKGGVTLYSVSYNSVSKE